MKKFFSSLQRILSQPNLRRKILFTAGILFVFRLLAHIPVPGVNFTALRPLIANNQVFNILNLFSGGSLANFSVMAVGINPYITASIIVQLAGLVFPSIKEMQKEGESGRERVNQYTRLLSVPMAVIQSMTVLAFLRQTGDFLYVNDPLSIITMISTLVAGSLIVMWLGELITLYGIGNGISIMLVVGILSQMPTAIYQLLSVTQSQDYLRVGVFTLLFIGVTMLMVFMNEAVRKIQIQYARRTRGSRVVGGQTSHYPIRINVSGVFPIITAASLLVLPPYLGQFLSTNSNPQVAQIGQNLVLWFSQTSFLYMAANFLIVFLFSYFFALALFSATDLAEELKKSGGFVPGIRPGGPTKKFLEYVVMRITFIGALFLGFIALLPSIAQYITNFQSLAIGGTSIMIVVAVILETAKQVEGMLVGQNYDKFI